MGVCEQCGNEYDKTFDVIMNGTTHTFDSFECATQKLAPTCAVCGTRILGHGMESENRYFCCHHCAEKAGVTAVRDRV